MIATFLLLLIAIAIRIAFGYFADTVKGLADWLPWLTWLCVVLAVVFIIFVAIRIIREVRR